QTRENREHRGELERVRRDVGAKIRVADDLLINLDLFGEAQVVGHLDHHDAVEDRLIGVVGLELLPLGLVGVGHDAGVDVHHPVAAGRRDYLFLGRRDHRMQVLGLVLEDLDKLDYAAVADVERAVELEHPRIAFGVLVELRDVLRADQHRGVLVVGIHRRDDADAHAVALGEVAGFDRDFLVALSELLLEPVATDRAEAALDVHAEHLFKLAPQLARDEMQRLFVHRAALDRVHRARLLQPALDALDERAFARADRAHQIEYLAALLALERGGMEIAHELRDGALDTEKLVGEEVIDLYRLVLVKALGARIVGVLDVAGAHRDDQVIDASVGELGDGGVGLDQVEVFEQRSAPLLGFASRPVLLDHALKVVNGRHQQTPCLH